MKLTINFKISSMVCTIILLISTLFYFLSESTKPSVTKFKPLRTVKKNPNIFKKRMNILPQRVVHLDLKGAPPRLEYYPKLFPLLQKLGATGILIEYEDMFPYSGSLLQNVSAFNSYTLEDIKVINSLAKDNNLTVTPFIRVLGHMDFILKLEPFSQYREVWNFPSTICPSFDNTLNLLREMIEQVMNAHPQSSLIHIGFEEVSHMGNCQRCWNRMLTQQKTRNDIFLDHLRSVIEVIKNNSPHVEVLIWDNHFRTLKIEDLQENPRTILKSFKPVVWWYGKDVYDELGPSLWKMYSKVFPHLWIASAFKGAVANNKYISDINHYVQNHKSWLSVIKEYHKNIHFEGIILTGWQRHDHFAVLCELLPVGLPALAMSLRLLQGFKNSALGPPLEVAKLLQCDQPYGLIGSAFGSPKCKFPGGDILENIIHFHQLRQEFDEIMDDPRVKDWLDKYNRENSFSNPQTVKSIISPLDKIKSELELTAKQLSEAMLEVYDGYTVDEWMATYLIPFRDEVLSVWEAKQKILGKLHWPRRPLNFNNREL